MKRFLLVALMVLVSLVGMVGFSRAGNEVSASQATANPTTGAVGTLQAAASAGIPVKLKMYYLTKNIFDGGDAITACGSGFHMSSLFELQGPTDLQYATSNSSAYIPARDEGSGPPAVPDGWVRTGRSSAFPDPFSRSDDCDLYTTRSIAVYGTTVHLRSPGDDPNIYPGSGRWISSETTCGASVRVWCVEDPE